MFAIGNLLLFIVLKVSTAAGPSHITVQGQESRHRLRRHSHYTRLYSKQVDRFAVMPQKRKRTETAAASAAPIYASEVEWLRGLVHRDTSYYDAINADDTNTKLIVEACKLTYILHHDIEAHDCLSLLLQSLNKGDGCDSANDVMKEARLKQSSWKGHILNKFFLPHVKELKRRWEIAHPYASFASLSDKEHTRTWMEPYDSDPESIASKMLKPVIMVLDLNNIFAVVPMTEDAKKMHAVRIMLRQKYWYGCYCTYKHSVAVDEKVSSVICGKHYRSNMHDGTFRLRLISI